MQTLKIEVEDGKLDILLNLIQNLRDGIIKNYTIAPNIDENLKLDSYLYERQKELHQLRDEVKSKKMPMYEWDEFEEEMDLFEKKLITKYANP
jgi:hypothetical protein